MKKILITGGSRGIGAATAELFASKGHEVLVASRTKPALRSERIFSFACDLEKSADVQKLVNEVKSRWGTLDVLVNNAGLALIKPITQLSLEDWERMTAVNVTAPFLLSKAAFELMRGRGGAIINISSLGGLLNTEKFPGTSGYSSSKAALIGLTESLAVEGKALGIRVNALALGAVDTQMLRDAAPFLKTDTKPEQVAEMIYALSEFANGAIVPLHSNIRPEK